MSDTAASLLHKIASADELGSVVRTMKAMAASNIGQYEKAVLALEGYYRTVQLGLVACLRQRAIADADRGVLQKAPAKIGALVFGSDQGLVGQFNERMVEFVLGTLNKLPGPKIVWAIGERIQSRLMEADLPLGKAFVLPSSIAAITPLVGQVLMELESQREQAGISQIYLFHNVPLPSALYEPACQQLLPLGDQWRRDLTDIRWPTSHLPEVLNAEEQTLLSFVKEFLFVTLFRACAESLASENASRLAAMQRAEKNINELLENLHRNFYRLRQSRIDEELFDLVSGFEALEDTKDVSRARFAK